MKNKLLTAILALFLPLVSAGQQSLTAYLLTSGPNADPATLVCNIDDDHVCSYFTNPITGFKTIGVMDITGFTAGIPVTPAGVSNYGGSPTTLEDLAFRDMQGHGGKVYFCGTHLPSSEGVVGSITFAGTTVTNVDYHRIPEVNTVTKLVVYSDPVTAGTHIVAIGKSATVGAPDMLIDLPAYTAATSTYTLVPMPEVTLDEVLTTADLVVLVGRESASAHNSVYYRVTKQSNVTGSAFFQQHHCQPGLNSALTSITYAAPLEAGELAVAYRQGADTLVVMRLAVDTLGTVSLVNAQKTGIAPNAPIAGMAYHANYHLLTVLLPDEVNSFLVLQPYGGVPYVAPEILCGRIPYCCSIDDVGGIGYVAGSANGLTVQRVGATVGGIATCEQQTGRLVLRAKVPPVARFKSTIDLLVFNATNNSTSSFSSPSWISVICNK